MVSVLAIGMRIIIKIRNMQSRVCSLLIRKKLAEMPCVESIRISLYSKKAWLSLSEDCTKKVLSVLGGLGYMAQVHR